MTGPIERPFVLLDDNLTADGRSYLFQDPRDVVVCWQPEELPSALERLESAQNQGLYCAGFLSYELGYLLEAKLEALLPTARNQPLLWMALFEAPTILSNPDVEQWLRSKGDGKHVLCNLTLTWDEERYCEAFDTVKAYICAGDCYQINLTLKYNFDLSGDLLAFYSDLRQKQRSRYGALIGAESFTVLSRSPELFLQVEGDQAKVRPMKGTAPRGVSQDGDTALAHWLQNDPKSRAENLMIVDLLRNDLGRSAVIGSVEVTDLYTIERYPTVQQMTSGITAKLRSGTTFQDLLHSLFPCGSVTGAPKVRAMEIIRELETEARGIYTGAIGMIAPSGDLSFNVAIRSLWLDAQGRGEMGIGSGVVYDSDPKDEFQECLLKARFLTDPLEAFQLIETLRWENGEYYLLERHLIRLEKSADYFHYPHSRADVLQALEEEATLFSSDTSYRVRLTLDGAGKLVLAATAFEPPEPDAVYRYVISESRVDSSDPFFYHKTTRRALYDNEFRRHNDTTGCDEVVFFNERDELAEGSRSNIFVKRGGVLLTPPLSAGILDGTFRRELIETQDPPVQEAQLTRRDLETAEALYLGNSVRGLVRMEKLQDAS